MGTIPASPAVVFLEKDNSAYAPNIESSVAGIVGYATKGPTNEATLITSQEQLIQTFGEPSESLMGQGLEGALEILEATNQLRYVRAIPDDAKEASTSVQFGVCPAVIFAASGFGVTKDLYLKVTVVNNDVITVVEDKVYSIPAGTAETQAEALKSVIGEGLTDSDYLGVSYDSNTEDAGYLVAAVAGKNASMTIYAASSNNFISSNLYENSFTVLEAGGVNNVPTPSEFDNPVTETTPEMWILFGDSIAYGEGGYSALQISGSFSSLRATSGVSSVLIFHPSSQNFNYPNPSLVPLLINGATTGTYPGITNGPLFGFDGGLPVGLELSFAKKAWENASSVPGGRLVTIVKFGIGGAKLGLHYGNDVATGSTSATGFGSSSSPYIRKYAQQFSQYGWAPASACDDFGVDNTVDAYGNPAPSGHYELLAHLKHWIYLAAGLVYQRTGQVPIVSGIITCLGSNSPANYIWTSLNDFIVEDGNPGLINPQTAQEVGYMGRQRTAVQNLIQNLRGYLSTVKINPGDPRERPIGGPRTKWTWVCPASGTSTGASAFFFGTYNSTTNVYWGARNSVSSAVLTEPYTKVVDPLTLPYFKLSDQIHPDMKTFLHLGEAVWNSFTTGGDDYVAPEGSAVCHGANIDASTFSYLAKSQYAGTGYNLSTTTNGNILGNSVTINSDAEFDKSTLSVNNNGVNSESFKVSLLDNSNYFEKVINISNENVTSDYIKGELTSDSNANISIVPLNYFHDPINTMGILGVTLTNWDDQVYQLAAPRFVKPIKNTYALAGGTNGTMDSNDTLIGNPSAKTGIYALDDDTLNISLAAVPGIYDQRTQNELITLAETSQNFLAVVAPEYGLNTVEEAVDWMNGRGSRTDAINSSWASVYWPHVQVFDVFSSKDRWYDPSIFAIRQMAYTDNVSETWFAPAGFRRGRLTKPTATEVILNQGDRDVLYSNNINPVVNFNPEGITIFGQKTAQRAPTSLDRINVRRLMIYLRKVLLQTGRIDLFEPNDQFTWEIVQEKAEALLADVQARRGITDFRVVCDETVNTPLRVDRNELWCKILLKPTKTAEWIIFEVNLTNQSAKFNG